MCVIIDIGIAITFERVWEMDEVEVTRVQDILNEVAAAHEHGEVDSKLDQSVTA